MIVAGALLLAASANAAVPSSERDALVSLYNATNGDSWTSRENWLGAPGTECSWYGVVCTPDEANVDEILLYGNNLTGTLPPQIGNFPRLRSLQVYDNGITGRLPAELGQLGDLVGFYADRNQFTGALPASLGNLKKLEYLTANGNRFNEPLPAGLGGMSALRYLDLSYNELPGEIPPDLGNLTNLEHLALAVNQLSGPVPAELGSLPKVETIALGVNRLDGPIPPELGNAPALVTLQLSYNLLDGTIPAELGQIRTLENLMLNNNRDDAGNAGLEGTIPDSFRNLVALKKLELTTNSLAGPIPPLVFGLTALEELQIGDNQFSGEIPQEIGALTNLRLLWLGSNALTGSIPREIGALHQLVQFEAYNNALSGPIPAELSGLTSLTYLDLASNELSGPIPSDLRLMSALETLSVYENQLTGTIPPELSQLSNLAHLFLAINNLEGGIPDSFRNLTKMHEFTVNGNRLTGPIPHWIGEWREAEYLNFAYNRFSGPLPAGLATLDNLFILDVGENHLTGPLPDFTRLTQLTYAYFQYNQFSGPVPASIGALKKLEHAQFNDNNLSGPLPREIAGLDSIAFLAFSNNSLEGEIPAEIGQLETADAISLWGNRFTGLIPSEIGNLTGLQYLDLSFNHLRGPIPQSITNLTGLEDHRSDFRYNALFTTSAAVAEFVNRKQGEEPFENTQTVTPLNVRIVGTTDRNATVSWSPIVYNFNDGGYQVSASTTPGGAPAAVATTLGKDADSITVRNLAPSTTYYFTVRAITHPHWGQKNLVVSDPSAPLQATTGPRVVAPAEVVLTDTPNGMVQIDGEEVGEDSFSLTNFGDVATTLTFERGGDFFTVEPQSLALAPGQTRVVRLHSTPQPAGTYYGHVVVRGEGAADDLIAYVVLLSSERPAGTVIAEPVTTRVEIVGEGSTQVGVAQFRNAGTARLRGVVVSDQPWVEVRPEPITIEPGTVGTVNFTVNRARRPEGTEGALTANLSLVYVTGDANAAGGVSAAATNSPIGVSTVTVVDVTKPPVADATLPPLRPGEIAFVLPGVVNTSTARSDLSIVNAAASRSLDDLKLYFTRGGQTKVATMQPLAQSQSVTLVNVLGTVYGAPDASGTLQVRTNASTGVSAGAKVTAVTPSGTFTGALPVFRADRSTAGNVPVYLTGLTAGGDLVVQETGGLAGGISVTFLGAGGAEVGSEVTGLITANGLLEMNGVIPANAVTAIVRGSSSSMALLAYARLHSAAGDSWSVVDWSRFYRYERTAAVRIPFAEGEEETGERKARRRAVRHGGGSNGVAAAATASRNTDVWIFNPMDAEVRVDVNVVETSGRVIAQTLTIAPRATAVMGDAAGGARTAVAQITVTPIRGEVVVSARTHDGAGGTAIPVLAATSGLRLGQTQTFSGLEDSVVTRTGYGFVETTGAATSVRARIIMDAGSNLYSAATERTFNVPAGGQLFMPDLLRSFAGDDRDELFGDEHGLALELEVVGGAGSLVPFVLTTDVASNDTSLMVQ